MFNDFQKQRVDDIFCDPAVKKVQVIGVFNHKVNYLASCVGNVDPIDILWRFDMIYFFPLVRVGFAVIDVIRRGQRVFVPPYMEEGNVFGKIIEVGLIVEPALIHALEALSVINGFKKLKAKPKGNGFNCLFNVNIGEKLA